jgi:glucosamine-phosphate N-acetyltransferase
MKIRKLTHDDYNLFFPLINQFRPTTFTEEQYKSTLSTILQSSEIWVVEDTDSSLIATATLIYESKFLWNTCVYAHIEDVCVRTDKRRNGIGKILVQHLIHEAKRNNCYKVTLDCASENVAFYTACGLSPRGTQMSELLSNVVL